MGRLSQKRLARERGLERLATRQQGVVARWQLIEMGFGEDAIRMQVAAARLVPVHREVFGVGHRRGDRTARWWAAVLAYGPGAVLSHRSAAAAWGIESPGRRPVDVTAPRGRQGRERRSGIWVHRCKLAAADRANLGGLPVTTVARTLFDLAETEPYERLQQAAQEADRLKLRWTREVGGICERGRGRRALRPVRRLLSELQPPDEGRSPLELRFPPFCRAHGIPLPEPNVTLLGHEVDGLWVAAKLVVELDSWSFHGHRAAFEGDRARDSKLLLAGYRIVRVTHRRLDLEAETLAAELRGLLGPRPADR
ncbi:MAG: hypothetical protein ACM3NV_08565 [Syntrophothermus sp.]